MQSWYDYVLGQLGLSFACAILIFVVIMGAEFLHWATDGKVPQLIDWQPPPKHRVILSDSDDEEIDDDNADGAEAGLIQYWNP